MTLPYPTLHSLQDAERNFEALGVGPNWQTPAFESGWVDYGETDLNFPARLAKSATGLVMLGGFVSRPSTTWTLGATFATLPPGFRPGSYWAGIVAGFGSGSPGWAYVQVKTDGRVALFATSVTWGSARLNLIGLSGIAFWAEN